MDEFLVSPELAHVSPDELQNFNNVLFMLDGFKFSTPPRLGKKNLSELSMNNCKLLQNLLPVNYFIIILASRIPFWTIFSVVFPTSNAGSVGADIVGFKILLMEY